MSWRARDGRRRIETDRWDYRDVLREAGESVEFRENSDDWAALAARSDESRRHARNAGCQRKAGVAQMALQERGTLRFLESELGITPDFLRGFAVGRGEVVNRFHNGG